MSKDGSYNGHKPRAFQSQEDMVAHLNYRRYKGNLNEIDSEYQAFVRRCIEMSDDNTCGADGQELTKAYGEPGRQEFQDPGNTLGGMTDFYRDMSEARRDQQSPRDRESAFERARVAEK